MFFIGVEAIMAESEASSSILIVWPAPEQQFEKVVLWPTPNATLGLGVGGRNFGEHKWAVPCSGGSWAVAPKKTTSTVERLNSSAPERSSRAAESNQHSRRAVVGGF